VFLALLLDAQGIDCASSLSKWSLEHVSSLEHLGLEHAGGLCQQHFTAFEVSKLLNLSLSKSDAV